jgi:hypothetical protein
MKKGITQKKITGKENKVLNSQILIPSPLFLISVYDSVYGPTQNALRHLN